VLEQALAEWDEVLVPTFLVAPSNLASGTFFLSFVPGRLTMPLW
jgi:hypothetical protein